jgi:hypothetical protein
MFNPLLAAALGFLAGIAFLALARYVFRRLGARRGPTFETIRPTFESIRPEVGPIRPPETIDEELIAVLAAAASETLQAPVRVLSHRVEPRR